MIDHDVIIYTRYVPVLSSSIIKLILDYLEWELCSLISGNFTSAILSGGFYGL
jgi:hypothetical protein